MANPRPSFRFSKGDPRINRTGANKGCKHKVSSLTTEQRRELLKAGGGITPLEFLASVTADDNEDMETRVKAAGLIAPYMHRKKPIAVDGGEGKPITIMSADKLASMTDEQLAGLNAALIALGAGLGSEEEEG